MRPNLVPVRGDGGASSDRGGQLKSTRGTVVIAGNLGIGGIGDGVANQDSDYAASRLGSAPLTR